MACNNVVSGACGVMSFIDPLFCVLKNSLVHFISFIKYLRAERVRGGWKREVRERGEGGGEVRERGRGMERGMGGGR